MKKEGYTGSLWKKLPGTPSDQGQNKSVISRGSSSHSRYTPQREPNGKESFVSNLAALKNKITSLKVLEAEPIEIKETGSVLTSPKSMSFLVKRTNSLEEDRLPEKLLEKYKIRNSNIVDAQMETCNKNTLIEQIGLSSKNATPSIEGNSNKKEKFIGRPMKMEFLANENESFEEESLHSHKDIDELYKYSSEWLNTIEKEIMNERIEIIKILDEKQRQFTRTKEKILKLFENKQKSKEIKETLEVPGNKLEMLPKTEKKEDYSLMRVTSEKIISKLNFSPRKSKEKSQLDLLNAQNRIETRSVVSGCAPLLKENFSVIFSTLNKMKKDLDTSEIPLSNKKIIRKEETENEKIKEKSQRKSEKFSMPQKQKNPLKVSLIDFSNKDKEKNRNELRYRNNGFQGF